MTQAASDQDIRFGGFVSARARARLVEGLRGKDIKHEAVLKAFSSIPRHEFLEEALKGRAYEDTALPIGYQQTISQPYIVGAMTEALELKGEERVLEIGTGSGLSLIHI